MDYDFQRGQYKFTKIKVEQIIKNRAYSAITNVWDVTRPMNIEFTMGGNSPQNCIEKLEKMFNVTFEPQDWEIIPKQKRK